MQKVEKLFLEAMKASLNNSQVSWDEELEPQDWLFLFRLAEIHHVLPLVYEAVYNCPAAKRMGSQLQPFKQRTVQMVMFQTIKTGEFLQLYEYLRSRGLVPCIVKGIVCRNLYGKPDCRMSGDEDMLIAPEHFEACHKAMLEYGMVPVQPERDIAGEYEVPYRKEGSPLYIELHKSLFPPESEAYGNLNRFFSGVTERLTEIPVQGGSVYTMNDTDHLFYLLCHSFKHFLHSGFGIRQVCDIVLFANSRGPMLDWQEILRKCREIHADLFAAAVFQIGRKYLTFDYSKACYPEEWRKIQIDEGLMLEDLLESGVYGNSSLSRMHSSNITLNAVAAGKKGRKVDATVLRTVFPPLRQMEYQYAYLKRAPFLLPVAWVDRILKYRKETEQMPGNEAVESIKIGSRRTKMMKQYGIIK